MRRRVLSVHTVERGVEVDGAGKGVAGCHLDTLQENPGTASGDAVCGESLDDLIERAKDFVAAESGRHLDTCFERGDGARGPQGTRVEVAEGAAAHGGRLAMNSGGHDVTAFFVASHLAFSCLCSHDGYTPLPLPRRGGESGVHSFQ